jgi:hypothetical protein
VALSESLVLLIERGKENGWVKGKRKTWGIGAFLERITMDDVTWVWKGNEEWDIVDSLGGAKALGYRVPRCLDLTDTCIAKLAWYGEKVGVSGSGLVKASVTLEYLGTGMYVLRETPSKGGGILLELQQINKGKTSKQTNTGKATKNRSAAKGKAAWWD